MGFPGFTNGENRVDEEASVEPKAKRGRRTLSDRQRGCDDCPLQEQWPRLTTPRMRMDGDAAADILVIGEAPGEDEDRSGRPFTGPSGELLRRILPLRQARRIAMTNAVRCRPPKNRNPSLHELHACSLHLEKDLTERPIKAILGLGAVPLSRVLTGAGITAIHGLRFPVELAGRPLWYFPTLHPAFVLHQQRPYPGSRQREESHAEPILENDIATFFREVDTWPEPVIERPDPAAVIQAHSEDEVLGWLAKMQDPIGLDIETNDLRAATGKAQILTAAIADGNVMVSWPIYHQQGANDWGLPLLLFIAATRRWVAHNAAFELAWLREHARRLHTHLVDKHDQPQPWGDDWWPEMGWDDSMAVARLYQRRETCLNLGILTRIYCGVNIKDLSTINVERVNDEPLPEVLRYNGLDAWGCWRIYTMLERQVDRGQYQALLDTITSTTEMHLAGVDVDQGAVMLLRDHWQWRVDDAQQRGADVHEAKRYAADRGIEYNIGSGVHVGEALAKYGRIDLPKTPNGQYKTDEDTLIECAPDHPLVLAVLGHRHAKKMLSTYIKPMQDTPTHYPDDRRLHPSYSTMGTRTFRLSSENPNIQNFPKRKDHELRTPVVPPEGHVWVAADFGQLEARVFGMASRDQELRRSIIAKEDIHSYWLNYILDRYPPYLDRLARMVTPNETEAQIIQGGRDIIKSDFTFASFYGSTAASVAEQTGIPLHIVQRVWGDFWELYFGAHTWLKGQRKQYRETGATRDLLGRERYGLMKGNEPINTPIQGTAAALVLAAQNELCQMAHEMRDPCLLPRINIHDDLVFAMPADDIDVIDVYVEEISMVLTKVRYRWQIIPLMVEWRIGDNWAELLPFRKYTGEYVQ